MHAQAWVTLGAALGAFVIAIVTLTQKHRADNRKEWWTRFQWALGLTFADTEVEQIYGWLVIDDLGESTLITGTEAGILRIVAMLRAQGDNSGVQDADGEGEG